MYFKNWPCGKIQALLYGQVKVLELHEVISQGMFLRSRETIGEERHKPNGLWKTALKTAPGLEVKGVGG